MCELRRIDIERGEEAYREIKEKLCGLVKLLEKEFNVKLVVAFGSYARRELNEGSDIDLLIVGSFKRRFHERTAEVIGLTDLPIEPLCYTENEFEEMLNSKNSLILEALKEGIILKKEEQSSRKMKGGEACD
ncbi:MAG: nucleotidyltransferase domain-containing protein [Candidatus Jordarchaeales archaeon]